METRRRCSTSVLASYDEPAVIYLDAHSVARNPLLDELRVIAEFPWHRHTLLIDDVRMFDTPDWHGLSKRDAMKLIYRIDPLYRISYRDTPNAPGDLMVVEP